MGKIIAISLIYFITSCHSTTDALKINTLSKTSTSWDNQTIPFPRQNEEITTIHITLSPKEKLPFHCHPVPTLAYMTSGTIEVEKMNGEKKLFNKGDEIIEVVNTWHRGNNPSLIKDATIIVFYVGQKNHNNTIYYNDQNKNKCRI